MTLRSNCWENFGATPEDNSTSQTLIAQADANIEKFKALHGDEFDRAYAGNELAYHQFVNQTVEETFIPSAQNPGIQGAAGCRSGDIQSS